MGGVTTDIQVLVARGGWMVDGWSVLGWEARELGVTNLEYIAMQVCSFVPAIDTMPCPAQP